MGKTEILRYNPLFGQPLFQNLNLCRLAAEWKKDK
jgi:hypothetical protein